MWFFMVCTLIDNEYAAMRTVLVYIRQSLTNVQLFLKYFCYGLNVSGNNRSHRISVI